MPATIAIAGRSLVIGVGEDGGFGAAPSRIEVPLSHVVAAEAAREAARRWLGGVSLGGTRIPGAIAPGWFHAHDEWVFWEVRDPERAIRIDVRDERFDRIVVDVEDPEAQLERIRAASERATRSA
jgi:hypothetical protein